MDDGSFTRPNGWDNDECMIDIDRSTRESSDMIPKFVFVDPQNEADLLNK